MTKNPTRPGPGWYFVATAVSAGAVTLFALRLAAYVAGIHLGRDLNIVTFVAVVLLFAAGIALFWRIDHRTGQAKKAEETRRARWVGYGQAAEDIFDPSDTGDTMDLLRI